MWYLQHKQEYKFITCKSYEQALKKFYRQFRDIDGSIPWTIEYNPR